MKSGFGKYIVLFVAAILFELSVGGVRADNAEAGLSAAVHISDPGDVIPERDYVALGDYSSDMITPGTGTQRQVPRRVASVSPIGLLFHNSVRISVTEHEAFSTFIQQAGNLFSREHILYYIFALRRIII